MEFIEDSVSHLKMDDLFRCDWIWINPGQKHRPAVNNVMI